MGDLTGENITGPERFEETTILVVDDEPAIGKLVGSIMTKAGFTCQVAHNAEQALECMRDKEFAVVVTDIMMPGMDGLKLTDIIKSNYTSDVIVMTGYSAEHSYEEAVAKGASDFIFKPIRYEELILRIKRVLEERRYRKEREVLLENLQRLALTDGLTELYNSRHFYNQLELEVNRSNRYKHPLSLLLMDIDNFKKYNDTYGHLAGNDVLIRLGQIITFCLRKMDTAYRYGGEEFTVILPETNDEEAVNVAERIRSSIESHKFSPEPGKVASVTVSIGVTDYCPDEDMASFVKRADKAMYITKKQGRNKVSLLLAADLS